MFKQQTLFTAFGSSDDNTTKKPLKISGQSYCDDNGYDKLIKIYENNQVVMEYLKNLNDMEKIVLNIAFIDLKSSFDIEKSQGYIKWLKSK